jgi:hypothetical protein
VRQYLGTLAGYRAVLLLVDPAIAAVVVLVAGNLVLSVAMMQRLNDQGRRFAALEGLYRESPDPFLGAIVGNRIPPFDLRTYRGDRVSDESLVGDYAMVAFLSPACPSCVDEVDVLVEAIKADQLPRTTAVVRGDGPSHLEIVDRLSDVCTVVIDKDGSLASAFGVWVSPAFLALDPNGVVTAASGSARELLVMPAQ